MCRANAHEKRGAAIESVDVCAKPDVMESDCGTETRPEQMASEDADLWDSQHIANTSPQITSRVTEHVTSDDADLWGSQHIVNASPQMTSHITEHVTSDDADLWGSQHIVNASPQMTSHITEHVTSDDADLWGSHHVVNTSPQMTSYVTEDDEDAGVSAREVTQPTPSDNGECCETSLNEYITSKRIQVRHTRKYVG